MSKRTVIEKIVSDCEEAVLNQKPIIVLRTGEIEIVRRVIDSDRLVTRLSCRCSNGVDNKDIVMTRSLSDAGFTRLFEGPDDKNNSIQDNFNICYLSEKELKSFTTESKAEYGLPKKFSFPHLYIVQYRCDASNPYSMWSGVDLNPLIDRFISESLSGSAISGSIILVFGVDAVVPPEYSEYCEIVDEPYPEIEEIREYLWRYDAIREQTSDFADIIAANLLGLPLLQVERIVKSLSVKPAENGEHDFIINDEKLIKAAIQKYKEQAIKKSSLLELIGSKSNDISSEIGGMENFRKWISEQEKSIKNGDRLLRESGAFSPKGVLLCGIPGCGKSMAVETVSKVLDLPLLKLDIGNLMGKYVGESEHNMINALKIAEAMSPCILFIDELDKGFSGAKNNSNDDAGPFKRMFGTLLGWMQNCKKPCFIFATANDISSLPKEFFRSGRFDCMYSVFMPTLDECVGIFKKQMKAAEERVKGFQNSGLFEKDCFDDANLKMLVNSFVDGEKRFVTGADIAKLVNMSLRTLWSSGRLKESVISWRTWEDTIKQTLGGTSVYGDGKENIDSIAICYVRLLRNNFISSSDKPLFEKYTAVEKEDKENRGTDTGFEIEIDESVADLSDYDRELKSVLIPLIKKYGADIERNTLYEMLK